MKNIAKKAISFSLMLSVLLASPIILQKANALEMMPAAESVHFSDVQENSDKIEIVHIGSKTINIFGTLDEAKVITSDNIDSFLKNETSTSKKNELSMVYIENDYFAVVEDVKTLDTILDKGYLVFFETNNQKQIDKAFSKITGYNSSLTNLSENDEYVVSSCFVAKNLAGEYFTGTLYSSKDTSSEENEEALMTSAWKQRNLHYYTKASSNVEPDRFSASAANGDLFTVNYKWKALTPWHQNSWVSGTSYLSEWMCFKGVRADDGYDYYAWCVESYITPANGCTDYVQLSSNAAYQSSGQLRYYDPKSTPQTNTLSFSIGADIKKGGVGLSIGASYSTSIYDLTIINNSNMGINLAKIKFDYSYNTAYSRQETLNCFSVIEKNTTNSSTFNFNHRREAAVIGNHINYVWDQNFYTTLNRPSA